MATQKVLQAQANELNRQQRNMWQYAMFSQTEYWKTASPAASTLIFGGTSKKREAALLSMLNRAFQKKVPMVVIANSAIMPDLIPNAIELTQSIPGARLVVTSSDYNNYDFFSGWSRTAIISFCRACLASDGYLSDTVNYWNSYLELVEKVYGLVSLRTILRSVQESRGTRGIKSIFRERFPELMDDETEETLTDISRSPSGRPSTYTLLHKMMDILGPLQAADDECYNLKNNELQPGEILIIDTAGMEDVNLLSLYLQEELKPYGAKLPFHLVICECTQEKLMDWAKRLLCEGSAVTLCCPSAYALLKDEITALPIHNVILLFNKKKSLLSKLRETEDEEDTAVPVNMEAELSILFGKMTKWDIIMGGGAPPVLFSFWTDTHAAPHPIEQSRVRVDDILRCEALLYGHKKNEISLIKYLLE